MSLLRRPALRLLYDQLRVDITKEASGWMALGEVPFEFLKRQLVGRFVLAVVVAALLHGVVGEVHQTIAEAVQREELAGCTDVAVLVPVPLDCVVQRSYEHIAADIELALLVQERHDVALQDKRSVFRGMSANRLLDFFNARNNVDAGSPISILTRLDEPNASAHTTVHKRLELGIVCASDVKCQRNTLERVQAIFQVVGPKVAK